MIIEYRSLGWWYWLLTDICLLVGVIGHPLAYQGAILLTIIQMFHFIIRDQNPTSFRVQVRVFYLLLLMIAQWPPLTFIYWLQLIGTTIQLLSGYCISARIVSLLPWNRKESFTYKLLIQTLTAPPVRGNMMQGLS